MTDINKCIIEMLNENKSMKEIASTLNISQKQLYIKIKQIINYGYQLNSSYNYNSDIYYKIEKKDYVKADNEISIKLSNNNKEFRCIVISDTHIGNKKSDINLIKRVYDYASKNDISIIFNCGDIIEGSYTTDRKSLNDVHSQVEYFVKNYPYDKNINNFIILGNHDYHSFYYDGLDISKKIHNSRYDIVPIGFGKGIVNVKQDSLLLEHSLSIVDNPKLTSDSKIALVGHGHMMKTKVYDKLYICIPTLSYVSPDKTKNVVPGFVDMKISLDKGKFEFLEAKHMMVTPKIVEASQSRCRIKTIFNKEFDNSNKTKWK